MAPNLAFVTALSLLLLLAGCTTTRPALPSTTGGTAVRPQGTALKPGMAVNDTCPISGGPVDPKVPGVEFEGRTVGFCSSDCTSKWQATPVGIKNHFVRTSEMKLLALPQSAASATPSAR